MEATDTNTPVRKRLIRAVRRPSRGLANVRKLIPQCSIEEIFEALVAAAVRGHLDVVQELIPLCDPNALGGVALGVAASSGHLDVVRQLLPVSDPGASDGAALACAARGGHAHMLRELLAIPDARVDIETALVLAACGGHVEAARVLLPVSDPKVLNKALGAAAANGHLDANRELLPVCYATAVFRDTARTLLQLIHECGLEEAGQSPELVALNALAPHVQDKDVECALEAVLEAPKQVLKAAPQLTAVHAAARLREAAPPAEVARLNRASL